MTTESLPIYHLTPADDYRRQPEDRPYQTASLTQEGFIHCSSGQATLIQVANAYFADLQDDMLVLEIDPAHLTSPLVFEPPAPVASQPEKIFAPDPDILFPHIYGPLNREAIVNCFELQRDAAGLWQIP